MTKKVALHTLGCKLNFAETSTIGNEFIKHGFKVVDINSSSDIFVLNTCSVTETAEKECRQIVRRVLRKNPDTFVIVTGCYSQLRPEQIASIDGVDVVLGSSEKFKLFSIIEDFNKKDLACIYVSDTIDDNEFGPAGSTDADSRTRAFLKVQDGCDYKCSFCTIPLARGNSRSMQHSQVLNSVKNLIDNNYKEIILTGVNVGDYGKSINSDLFSLLKDIINIPGDFRIRISSIEPNLITDDIISLVANSDKLCNHFHIPLQSGSAKILKLMQRRYSKDYYFNLIEKLNNRIPYLGIGVDVIVGFPGEDENDFLETYNFIKELNISYLHVFTYSERPQTKAVSMPLQVDKHIRKTRNNMLRILSEKKRNSFYRNMIGKTLNVLFESHSNDNSINGFSSNYVKVSVPFDNALVNSFTKVKILDVQDTKCKGEILGINKSIDLVQT